MSDDLADHPTSIWARQYGVPDPALAAEALLRLMPAELSARFRAVSLVADRIDAASNSLLASLGPLRVGWNSDAAGSAVTGLLAAAQSGSRVLRAQAEAGTRVADVLATARTTAVEAYAVADATIARADLLRPDHADAWPSPTSDSPLDIDTRSARIQVVTVLAARIDLASITAGAAIAALHEALSADPRERLDVLGGPAGPLPPRGRAPGARDDAHNRAALAADLAGGDPASVRFAAAVADALARAAGSAPPGTPVQLLVYDPLDPAGQGGAAIAIGDVSAADNVAVLVPGVGNSPSDMSGAVDALTQLRSDAAATDPQATVAAVAWLDYDVPVSWMHDFPMTPAGALTDSLTATDGTDAIGGGARLAAFADRLRTETIPSTHLTLIGHSYGSVVVSQAALHSDAIDDIVLLAAPGAGPGVHDSGDYASVTGDHVFALSFDDDPVTTPVTDLLAAALVPAMARPPGPPFGPDPAGGAFGAEVIDAPSNVPTVELGAATAVPGGLPQAALVDALTSIQQHPLKNYLAGAAGLAVGAVVVGRYTAVRTRRGR